MEDTKNPNRMSVEIKEVRTRSELRKFVNFPELLYKDNPCYVPPLVFDQMDTLDQKKGAAQEFCESRLYLAYKDGKPAGRVAAIVNNLANSQWNHKEVRFGWYDFIDDTEVSSALMAKVEEFGREKGMESVVGPLGFSLDEKSLHRAGLGYWDSLDVTVHESWDAFVAAAGPGARLHLGTCARSSGARARQRRPPRRLVRENACDSPIQSRSSPSISSGHSTRTWCVQRWGYGSVAMAMRGDSLRYGRPKVTIRHRSGQSRRRLRGSDAQANPKRSVKTTCVF